MRRSTTVLLAVGLSLLASSAFAVVARVFVSVNGNDSNVCSNVATPCRTFAGGILQVDVGGQVIVLDSGSYGGTTITNAVTINVPPGVVAFTAQPLVVNAPGATVALRGLTIHGAGASASGINVTAVGALHVENCVITGFTGSGSTGNGIYFGSAGNLFVKDTIIRGNTSAGISVIPASSTARASVDHCRLEANEFGLACDANASATVRDSVASGNSNYGFTAQSGGEINIESCASTNNSTGIGIFTAGTVIRVSNTTVTDNGIGLFISAGSLLSRGNNTVEGNTTADGGFSGFYSAK
jgi:nitrous oxidase accessory protein NosD